jgi:nitrite reductase/ring-hydroxylating ferredoxin subunit
MQTNTQTHGENTPNRSESPKGDRFRTDAVRPGRVLLISDAVVFNTASRVCAADAKCPGLGSRLNEGTLESSSVTCPWQRSEFDVCTGAVLEGPAKDLVKIYAVTSEREIGHKETGK